MRKSRKGRMMTGRRQGPPVEFNSEDGAALGACRAYLKEALDWLAGRRDAAPDIEAVVSRLFSHSTIKRARHGGDDFGPYVACAIADDLARQGEERNERLFDPWYFIVMRFLEISGGRFRFDRSKREKYFYPAFAGPKGKEGNHYLRRIIANTPSWADTREGQRGHHDCRRAAFQWMAKRDVVDKLGQQTRSVSRVRDQAVAFAVRLFSRHLGRKRKMPGLNITRPEYEGLLRLAIEVADRMHERHLSQRTSP